MGWAPGGLWHTSESVDWKRGPDSPRLTMPGGCRLSRVLWRQANQGTTENTVQIAMVTAACHSTENDSRTAAALMSPLQDVEKWSREQKPSAESTSKRIGLNLEYDLKKSEKERNLTGRLTTVKHNCDLRVQNIILVMK